MVSVNRTTTVAVLIQLFLLLVFALEAGSYRFSGITSRATARTLTASHFPVLHSVINGAEQLATIDLDGQKIQQSGISRTFFIETHGCQMNLADSDIARAVLLSCGFVPSNSLEEAELVLINTCAIRENAESKVWQRIKYFESIRKKHRKDQNSSKIRAIDSSSVPNDTAKTKTPEVGTRPSTGSGSDVNAKFRSGKRLANQYYPIIGVLGCMAERLKQEMLKDQAVDFIAGPDAYRELPSLLLKIGESLPSNETLTDESAALAVASMSKGSSFISSVNELSADTAVEEAMSRSDAEDNRAVANLHLSFSGGDSSLDLSVGETYSDITPVREDILSQDGTKELRTHAFVTITRGCDNHCAFCVVPYTRGKERSRSVQSILKEIHQLSAEGVKEIVLLGQNVNSYFDTTTKSVSNLESYSSLLENLGIEGSEKIGGSLADGFTELKRPKGSKTEADAESGVSFGELLFLVSQVNPEMRVRFQAPHPKGFPDDVLQLIAALPNVCNSLHMPAQHGSSSVLERMKRGYSAEAYRSLIARARKIIAANTPEGVGLGISSDFISGFCGETEAEHQDHVSLIKECGFDQAFTYSYSKREQTYAGVHYEDDVPDETKSRRLREIIDAFYTTVHHRNTRLEIGRLHAVLVEGLATQRDENVGDILWTGRTDTNKRVVFRTDGVQEYFRAGDVSTAEISSLLLEQEAGVVHKFNNLVINGLTADEVTEFSSKSLTFLEPLPPLMPSLHGLDTIDVARLSLRNKIEAVSVPSPAISVADVVLKIIQERLRDSKNSTSFLTSVKKGDYIIVKITGAKGHTLRGEPIAKTTLQAAYELRLPQQ